jgi:hypothetical protein
LYGRKVFGNAALCSADGVPQTGFYRFGNELKFGDPVIGSGQLGVEQRSVVTGVHRQPLQE